MKDLRLDRSGALRWAGALALLAALAIGAVMLGMSLGRAVKHESEAVPVTETVSPSVATVTTAPAKSTLNAVVETVPSTATTVPMPLTTVFVKGPSSVPAGTRATYCVTGSPSPIAGATVTLDGITIGPLDESGCVKVTIETGPHDLYVVAFGADGSSAATTVSITGSS